MKKTIGFLVCLLVACSSFKTTVVGAQPVKEKKAVYSQIWQPISGKEMQQQIYPNSQNAVALHQLWWRARTQDVVWYYILALNKVVKEQPNNATALAAYSNALLDSVVTYASTPSFQRAKADLGEDLTIVGIRKRINQAKKLDRKQWLIYVIESEIAPFEESNLVQLGRRSELFARRAVALSDNSITNATLAHCLLNRASWDNSPRYIDQAIAVAKRAQKQGPVYPQASAFLLRIYKHERKNAAEVKKVEQTILSTIPPRLVLSKSTAGYLEQLGIKVSA